MNQLLFLEGIEFAGSGLVVFVWDFLFGGSSESFSKTRDAVGVGRGGFTFDSWLGLSRGSDTDHQKYPRVFPLGSSRETVTAT